MISFDPSIASVIWPTVRSGVLAQIKRIHFIFVGITDGRSATGVADRREGIDGVGVRIGMASLSGR
jgi:hypothetical protein